MNAEYNKVIGKVLFTYRTDANLTQTTLAKRLGKRQSFISKLESGERVLCLYEVFDYCKALGVDSRVFFNHLHDVLDSSITE